MQEQREVEPIVRSDSLRTFLRLVDSVPGIRPCTGTIFQVIAVLDASQVQREIRWRLKSRKDANARTRLHETIASGALLVFAPPFLETEIEKYIPKMAKDTGVSVERVTEEWHLFKPLIRFYEPLNDGQPADCVDLKDLPYIQVQQQLGADFVCTTDPHFAAMGARVMPDGFDVVLRDYARASSVLVTVKLGSSVAIIGGVELISAFATLVAGTIRRLPPAVKVLSGLSLGLALLHPISRERLLSLAKSTWEGLQVGKPALIALFLEGAQLFAEAAKVAVIAEKAIASTLPAKSKLSSVAYALLVCMKSGEPLPIAEIARRIQLSGYESRSKKFTSYVRRILRNDARFERNSNGLWGLRTGAIAA